MDRVAGGRRGQWVAVWTARATTEQRQQGGNGNKEAVATRMQWQQGSGGNMGAGNRGSKEAVATRTQWQQGSRCRSRLGNHHPVLHLGCSLLQPLTKMQEHVAEGTILSEGLWHAHACSYGSVPTVLWGTHTSSEACRLCLEVCSNWFILIAARWSETGKLRGRPTTRNLVPPDYSDVVSAPREKHSGCTIVLGYNQGRSQAN